MAKSTTTTPDAPVRDAASDKSAASSNQPSRTNGNGNSGSPPETTFRVGRVSASVFINSVLQRGNNGNDYTRRFRTVTIQRSYKDENDKTKYVSSFGLGEIRNAIRVLELAAEHLESKEACIAD